MNTNNDDFAEKFINFYNQLPENLGDLSDIYHQDCLFEDPFHEIQGLYRLGVYFNKLYENIIECCFEVRQAIRQDQNLAITWLMHLRHKKIQGGTPYTVSGASWLRLQDNKIIYHRDYFDAGNLLYEQLPILGYLIKKIKAKI